MSRRKWKHLSRHHLLPKSRGGTWDARNILILRRDKHDFWHMLFGNRTIPEIIALLKRVERMKAAL